MVKTLTVFPPINFGNALIPVLVSQSSTAMVRPHYSSALSLSDHQQETNEADKRRQKPFHETYVLHTCLYSAFQNAQFSCCQINSLIVKTYFIVLSDVLLASNQTMWIRCNLSGSCELFSLSHACKVLHLC